ncbi:UNVERIFIED_CONTAM: hypothetical protein FKN15_003605 [Acipenser sinensis]
MMGQFITKWPHCPQAVHQIKASRPLRMGTNSRPEPGGSSHPSGPSWASLSKAPPSGALDAQASPSSFRDDHSSPSSSSGSAVPPPAREEFGQADSLLPAQKGGLRMGTILGDAHTPGRITITQMT